MRSAMDVFMTKPIDAIRYSQPAFTLGMLEVTPEIGTHNQFGPLAKCEQQEVPDPPTPPLATPGLGRRCTSGRQPRRLGNQDARQLCRGACKGPCSEGTLCPSSWSRTVWGT